MALRFSRICLLALGAASTGWALESTRDIIPPQPPQDLRVDPGSITDDYAVVSWRAPLRWDPEFGMTSPVATVSGYQLYLSPVGLDTSSVALLSQVPPSWAAWRVGDEPLPALPGLPQSMPLRDLEPGKTCFVTLGAYQLGSSPDRIVFSSTSFTTLPVDLDPPAKTTVLAVIPRSSTELEVRWFEPCEDGSNPASGAVATQEMVVSADPITVQTWEAASPVANMPLPAGPDTPRTLIVTGLSPGTWHVAIRTWDAARNPSLLSDPVSVTLTEQAEEQASSGQSKPACGAAASAIGSTVLLLVLAFGTLLWRSR